MAETLETLQIELTAKVDQLQASLGTDRSAADWSVA